MGTPLKVARAELRLNDVAKLPKFLSSTGVPGGENVGWLNVA
jgi:hypothetical protein